MNDRNPPDARFRDGDPGPLMLRAQSAEDVSVISMLCQDAVLTSSDVTFDRRTRQLALLINRFRWEDAEAAEREGRTFERVRALLVIGDVTGVKSDGIDRGDQSAVVSLLAIGWVPGEDGTGRLMLEFAGDGTVAVDAECIAIDLRDVTRPHAAVAARKPDHAE